MSEAYQDFGLELEHIQFRDQFRRFVADRLAPIARRAEIEKAFPLEVYDLLRQAGYLGINYPEAIGGGGGDLLMGCLFYEELTRAAAGVSAGVFAHQHLALGPIVNLGTPEQQAEFQQPAIEGRRIGAFCLTEPDAGSDIRGIRTTARRDGDDFVLNGSKLYITNGTIADFMLVAARTGEARAADALTIFIVDAKDPGITTSHLEKVGNHSSSTAFISIENVRVPQRRVLGEIGRGLAQLKATLTDGRILVANRGLGLAQEAVDLILELRAPAPGVRENDRKVPGRRLQDCGSRGACRRGAPDDLSRGAAAHGRTRLRTRGVDGQAAGERDRGASDQHRPAAPWRCRLHGGHEDRATLS